MKKDTKKAIRKAKKREAEAAARRARYKWIALAVTVVIIVGAIVGGIVWYNRPLEVVGKTFIVEEQSFVWKDGTANDSKLLVYDNYEATLESYEVEGMSDINNDEDLQRAMELIAEKKDPIVYTFTEDGKMEVAYLNRESGRKQLTSTLYYSVDEENDKILVYADEAKTVEVNSFTIDRKTLTQVNEVSYMRMTLVYRVYE